MQNLLDTLEQSIDIPALEDTSQFEGIVFYTDGGSRVIDRTICCGYGVHAYTYVNADKVKIGEFSGFPPTAIGYRPSSEKEHKPVQIVDYIDVYGDGIGGTNNVGELLGLIAAITIFKKYNLHKSIKTMVVRSDSEYVIQGTNKQLAIWEKNGYRRSDGGEIKNIFLWKKVGELRHWLIDNGVELDLQWVKGHVDYGNIKADKLATMGVFTKKTYNHILNKHAEIAKDVTIPSLLVNSKLLHYPGNTIKHDGKDVFLVYNNSCAQDTINKLGRNLVDSSIGLVMLGDVKTPELDRVKKALSYLDEKISYTPKVVDIDYVTKPENLQLIERSDDLPIVIGGRDITIETPNGNKLVTIIDPPRNSYNTLDNLRRLMERYLAYRQNPNEELYTYTDITDKLFEVIVSKKGKVTHKHIGADQPVVEVDLPLWKDKGTIHLPIALTFGLDLPPHRVFFNLKEKQPKVHVLTWYEDECISYMATVIECSEGVGVWCAEHTNVIFTRGT